MPSTHLSLHYHLVFSTKNRVPCIAEAWRGRLHAYLGGVVRNVEGVPEAIDGVADHVHLLIGLRGDGVPRGCGARFEIRLLALGA
ncbi:MAG: transposase [Verrucomicrobiota bacterium]